MEFDRNRSYSGLFEIGAINIPVLAPRDRVALASLLALDVSF